MQVESVSHHYDVLGKRLVLDSTDRENHFLSRFETVAIHNVGQDEGNLGAVRAINNSKPLRVNFLNDSYHFVSSPGARLFSFSISLGHPVEQELPYSQLAPLDQRPVMRARLLVPKEKTLRPKYVKSCISL
jgi:hypothetical protein